MSRWPLFIVFLVVLAGCQSNSIGIDPRGDASIRVGSTKAEIIERLGLPEIVRNLDDGGQELRYEFTRGEGLATGLAGYGIRFTIRHTHLATTSLTLELDENDVVDEIQWSHPVPELHVTAWPFGD